MVLFLRPCTIVVDVAVDGDIGVIHPASGGMSIPPNMASKIGFNTCVNISEGVLEMAASWEIRIFMFCRLPKQNEKACSRSSRARL